MTVNLKTLDNLLHRFERKSYFDVLDVEVQAKALLSSGRKLREDKLNKLYNKVEQTGAKWSGYYNFWKKYKYKSLFKKFDSQILPIKKKLLKANDLAKMNSSSTYKEAVATLNEAQVDLKLVESSFNRMNFVSYIVNSSAVFGKKLLITEIAVTAFGILLCIGLGFVPNGTAISEFANLFSDAWFQKRAILFATLFLSPVIALSWTLISLSKE